MDELDTKTKEWNELSLHDRIKWLPKRHPYPVKCMLYLVFNISPVSWKAVHMVLEHMGYVSIAVEEELSDGVVRTTRGWSNPEQVMDE